jgi:biotin transport system substrate-specific component
VNTVQVNSVQVEVGMTGQGQGLMRERFSAADIARVAVLAAVVAALGLPGSFTVLGSVPITAQTLGVMLAGVILGPRLGALSMLVLLALVAVGLPLLAGGRGGIAVFAGPSGGFALGWIAGAAVAGAISRIGPRKLSTVRIFAGAVIGGIGAIYAVGIPFEVAVTHLPLAKTALTSLVFIPGDLAKAVVTTIVARSLVRAYPRAFRDDMAPSRRREQPAPAR